MILTRKYIDRYYYYNDPKSAIYNQRFGITIYTT